MGGRSDLAGGRAVTQPCKKIRVPEQTHYLRREEDGDIRIDQAEQMKDLGKENARLKRLLGDAELDKAIPREASFGKLLSPAKRGQAVQHVRNSLG